MSDKLEGRYEYTRTTYFVKPDDDRYKAFVRFKKKHGFSPDESWSLYSNICDFILPRLKYYRKTVKKVGCNPGCFNSNEEWIAILDKMIFAFNAYGKEDDFEIPKSYLGMYKNNETKAREAYWKDIDEGMKLFAKYFGHLWW